MPVLHTEFSHGKSVTITWHWRAGERIAGGLESSLAKGLSLRAGHGWHEDLGGGQTGMGLSPMWSDTLFSLQYPSARQRFMMGFCF